MLLDINRYLGNLAFHSPFIDANGIIRVEGRLSQSNFNYDHKCLITLSAIRDAWFFIHRASSTIRKFASNGVICKKLRRPIESQRMNGLPPKRLGRTPPFTNTGIDVFGPLPCLRGHFY